MAMEVEVKAYATNLKAIEENVKSMGAELRWQGEQVDTYYNHPNRNFAETDEALRIREEEGQVILTYKGPKVDSNTKTREEIKVVIKDITNMKEILINLDFKEVAVVKKHRSKYYLEDFKICLDKVENLGEFVEVEAPVPETGDKAAVENSKKRIFEILEQLGLKDMERRSYLELLFPELQ